MENYNLILKAIFEGNNTYEKMVSATGLSREVVRVYTDRLFKFNLCIKTEGRNKDNRMCWLFTTDISEMPEGSYVQGKDIILKKFNGVINPFRSNDYKIDYSKVTFVSNERHTKSTPRKISAWQGYDSMANA